MFARSGFKNGSENIVMGVILPPFTIEGLKFLSISTSCYLLFAV
jgi:hypothetical protein